MQKKKVLRKKADDDEDMTELAKTTAALEAAAEVAGTGSSDRGSRALRESLAAKEAAAAAEKAAERTARSASSPHPQTVQEPDTPGSCTFPKSA